MSWPGGWWHYMAGLGFSGFRNKRLHWGRSWALLLVVALVAANLVAVPARALAIGPAVPAATPVQLPSQVTPLGEYGSFVDASYQDFLGRAPSVSELSAQSNALATGSVSMTNYLTSLATSDEWLRVIVTKMYSDTLGRAPDAAGLASWVGWLRTGRYTVAQVASLFYASDEYYMYHAGNSATTWVTLLYQKLLSRAPDAAGLAGWVSFTNDARYGKSWVAYQFFQSLESRLLRVQGLYQALLYRGPDATGWPFWAQSVLETGDITLAINLAGSQEYWQRAQTRFPPISAAVIVTSSLPAGTVGSAYASTLAGSGGTTPYSWSATGLPGGLSLDSTTGVIRGTPTTAGSSPVAITLTDAGKQTVAKTLTFSIVAAPVIVTSSLPDGTVDGLYSFPLTGAGGTTPYSWSATGLPAGLNLDSNTGVISGTPTTVKSSSVVVTLTDTGTQTVSKTLDLSIIAAPLIVTPSLPDAVVGSAYSASLAGTGGTTPYSWSATGLPGGLSLEMSTGVVSGTPTMAGSSLVTIALSDASARTVSGTIRLVVVDVLTIPTNSLPVARVGNGYSTTVAGGGGTTPYIWSATGLPDGLSMDSTTGEMSGTPTTAGSSAVTITVADASGRVVSRAFSMEVLAGVLTIITDRLPPATVGAAYSTTLAGGGGATPYAWSATGLASGLSLDATTGLISGTPTAGGSSSVVVTLTDASEQTAPERQIQMVVQSDAVSQISHGTFSTCALTSGGGVKCWGQNGSGQLGDGTTADSWAPVDVVGLGSVVTAITQGSMSTCALTTGGGVKCWGSNYSGELGDGTTTGRLGPVDVLGLSSGVAAISSGDYPTCALTTGGGVKCWGSGYGSTPVGVVGLASGVTAISTGAQYTCALTTNGGVKCWGVNNEGELGNGTTGTQWTPVDVLGLSSGVIAISAGNSHACALTTVGGVKCWGYGVNGSLGDASQTIRLTPVGVVGLSSGVTSISAGADQTCALTTGGGVKCWGGNYSGDLGDGTTTPRSTPVDVAGLSSGVTSISAGELDTCAVTSGGGAKCWGFNLRGQLGDGTTIDRATPVDVVGLYGGYGVSPLRITSWNPPAWTLNSSGYSAPLAAGGGSSPYAWSSSGLPTGLSLDADTGIITGTPTTAGSFRVSVTVTDDALVTVSKTLSLTVNAVPMNRPGVSGDSKPWEGWSHAWEHVEEVSG
jgi:alpha-tubulin suppressor-like RCC1 family protein